MLWPLPHAIIEDTYILCMNRDWAQEQLIADVQEGFHLRCAVSDKVLHPLRHPGPMRVEVVVSHYDTAKRECVLCKGQVVYDMIHRVPAVDAEQPERAMLPAYVDALGKRQGKAVCADLHKRYTRRGETLPIRIEAFRSTWARAIDVVFLFLKHINRDTLLGWRGEVS